MARLVIVVIHGNASRRPESTEQPGLPRRLADFKIRGGGAAAGTA
jgi:hypothetical protein